MNDSYDKIEEEIKEKDAEKEKTKQKVDGRSVFELKKIIEEKASEEGSKEENDK